MSREKTTEKIVTIIGGGPSGMTAAIFAADQGAKVRLIEKNEMLGRKLLATGNGRCNLTNINCSDAEETIRFFSELGLLTRIEAEGRVYPYTEQAAAVQEALIAGLQDRKVEIYSGMETQTVEQTASGFTLLSGKESFFSDAVILATGGKAGPQYGSTGDGYRFAKAFGHTVVRPMPSLVQMVSEQPFFKALKGVRAKGCAELLRDGRVVDREIGEIQFTEDGLSGICIFNLSKEYVRGDIIRIDLFPEYSEEALEAVLTGRINLLGGRSISEFFIGLLQKKLIPVVLTQLSLDSSQKVSSLSRENIAEIVGFLKGWSVSVSGTKGWKEAQVTAGGVDLAEIDLNTMESRLVPNLFFAGELLNVDEKCGGFNLQWAWTSGRIAGRSAVKA